MTLKQRAVGTFSTYAATETALHQLKDSGFSMEQVSIVGHDIDRHIEATGVNTSNQLAGVGNLHNNETKETAKRGNEAEEAAKKGAVAGSTLGGLTGLLVGLGAIAIPGVGPVMLAGAAATAIATAISGGVIGAAAGSLVGALIGLGIPEDRAKVYSDRVSQGDYLIVVEGSEADINHAKSILNNHSIDEWYVYDLPNNSVPTTTIDSPHHQRV
jgi:hypothetical protein